MTADTFNKVRQELSEYSFNIHILTSGNEIEQKKEFVENLNPDSVVAFGNGSNDLEMLKVSALGIAIIGREGMSSKVITNGDIIVRNIQEGIDLLFHLLRIKSTLRS